MAINRFDKLIKEQTREQKRRDRKQREQDRMNETIQRATAIVDAWPTVNGMKMMDETSEEILRCLLKKADGSQNTLSYGYDEFPKNLQNTVLDLELEKLTLAGMISVVTQTMGGVIVNVLAPAFKYFENKEQALLKQKEDRSHVAIRDIYNNGGNVFRGNIINSDISIDNTISNLEQAIDENGEVSRDELMKFLDEIKELLENVTKSRSIPKDTKLHEKILRVCQENAWITAPLVQAFTSVFLKLLG